MSKSKEKLRRAMDNIPLDNTQRDIIENGIKNMSDEEVKKIAEELEHISASLPETLNDLYKALNESRKQREK